MKRRVPLATKMLQERREEMYDDRPGESLEMTVSDV